MRKNLALWLMKKRIIFILGFYGIFSSCSTDFEINAPYKETIVVYGLLNTLDTAQFIRISKAYLGEGNALVMAQEPDSINYADILDVKMERWQSENGPVLETFSLQRTDTIPKDEGIFAAPYQVYYRTNHPISDDGSLYQQIQWEYCKLDHANCWRCISGNTHSEQRRLRNPILHYSTIYTRR